MTSGITALILGARAGFNPLEFVDFLLGFGGIDLADDDPPAEEAANEDGDAK